MRKITVVALMAVFMVVAMAVAQGTTEPAPVAPSMKVVSPAAGDKWEEGSVQNVVWSLTSRLQPDSIKIVIVMRTDGGSGSGEKETVLTTIYKENPGKWEWTKVGPVAKKLRMEVRAFIGKTVVKGSQSFGIVAASGIGSATGKPPTTPILPVEPVTPAFKITSPNGGETWRVGETKMITWAVSSTLIPGTTKTVEIYMSRDGGATYREHIAKAVPFADTEFKYAVDGTPAEKCLVKIALTGSDETSAPQYFDVSDAPFRIISLTVQPPQGETHD